MELTELTHRAELGSSRLETIIPTYYLIRKYNSYIYKSLKDL